MSDWHTFADRGSLDQALATHVASRLQQGIAERGTAHLVVSGGSTPIKLFSILADADIEWDRIVVLLADERWVPVDHEDSNERLVRDDEPAGHHRPKRSQLGCCSRERRVRTLTAVF